MKIVLLFLAIVLLECIALYSVKRYSQRKEELFLILSVLGYSVIPILLILLIREKQNIATVNIIWNILSTVYGLMIGVLIFSEKITPLQVLGIIMGTLSLLLIFLGHSKE